MLAILYMEKKHSQMQPLQSHCGRVNIKNLDIKTQIAVTDLFLKRNLQKTSSLHYTFFIKK